MFAAVGEAWGRGDGSTTFNVPDLRGRFLRGTDSGIGRDPDRIARIAINPGGNTGDAIGSLQADAIQGHAHSISHLLIAPADARGVPRLETSDQSASPYAFNTAEIVADGAHGTPRVSAESRPQNANVTYIIKD